MKEEVGGSGETKHPARWQVVVVTPAFLLSCPFKGCEVWVLVKLYLRRHVSTLRSWSLLNDYGEHKQTHRHCHFLKTFNYKQTYKTLSLSKNLILQTNNFHCPMQRLYWPQALSALPPPCLSPPWSLPTSAPPCTTCMLVRITFAWCLSLFELRISPSWLHIKVPSSTHIVNAFL